METIESPRALALLIREKFGEAVLRDAVHEWLADGSHDAEGYRVFPLPLPGAGRWHGERPEEPLSRNEVLAMLAAFHDCHAAGGFGKIITDDTLDSVAFTRLVGMARLLSQDDIQAIRTHLDNVASCSHSEDFTSATWFGERYSFSKGNQAQAIKALWEAWESGGHSLSQETIADKIGSASDNFRLSNTFRGHPAWGAMIIETGKGVFSLAPENHG